MIVCICKNICSNAIQECVKKGARNFDEVQQTLQVATQCGKCNQRCHAVVSQCLTPPKTIPAPAFARENLRRAM